MAQRELLAFHKLIGVKTIDNDNEDGKCELQVEAFEDLGNRRGNLHGGAVAAYLDIAMARALHTVIPNDAGIATISMTINYMEPAIGNVTVKCQVERAGGSIAVLRGEVVNPDATIAANASAVFRIQRRS